jgi:hypothetical protein
MEKGMNLAYVGSGLPDFFGTTYQNGKYIPK